jgi:hypothetical protein
MGTGVFPGVKRPGRGADHPPPPSAEVENTSTPPLDPGWPVVGVTFTFTFISMTTGEVETQRHYMKFYTSHKRPHKSTPYVTTYVLL